MDEFLLLRLGIARGRARARGGAEAARVLPAVPAFVRCPFRPLAALAMIDEGKAVPLFSQGFIDGKGKLVADPSVPDLPTVADVYRSLNNGADPEGPAWSAYMAMTGATVSLGRVLMVHEEAPDAAVEALEQGIASMLADPVFLKEIDASLNGYAPYAGEELEAAINATKAMSEDDKTWLQDFLARAYGARFE